MEPIKGKRWKFDDGLNSHSYGGALIEAWQTHIFNMKRRARSKLSRIVTHIDRCSHRVEAVAAASEAVSAEQNVGWTTPLLPRPDVQMHQTSNNEPHERRASNL